MKRVIFRQNETNRRRLPPSPDGFGATGQAALIFAVALALRLVAMFVLGDLPISRTPQLDSSAYLGWAGALVNDGSFWPVYPEHAPGYPIFMSVILSAFERFADGGAHPAVDPGRDRLRADRAGGVTDAHASRIPAGRTAAGCLRPADLHRYGDPRGERVHLPVDPGPGPGDGCDRARAGVCRRACAWPRHDRETDRARGGDRVRDRAVVDAHQAARDRRCNWRPASWPARSS